MSILTPASIGNAVLKNRILFPSMCNFYCDAEGFVTPQLKAFVRARAEGGAGAIIMPGSPHGKPSPARPALYLLQQPRNFNRLVNLSAAGDPHGRAHSPVPGLQPGLPQIADQEGDLLRAESLHRARGIAAPDLR